MGIRVSLDNLRPEKENIRDREDVSVLLREISDKLSILIKYEALLHKIDLEEDNNAC